MAESSPLAARIGVSGTRYALVRQVAELMNMTVVELEDEDCDLYWIDAGIPLEKFMQLKPHQMINHFSGMGEISRKDCLARNIHKMKSIHKGEEYNIVPKTWVFPSDYGALSTFMKEMRRRGRNKTYIIKPYNSSMGNGIRLARSLAKMPQGENVIVQEYIDKPLLLDGYKFDLRVYVLVTSCNPLRVFIYKDGLTRLSTETYAPPTDSNIDKHFMHLTNYSINKHSESFDHHEDFDKGSKRSLKYFNSWLIRNGYNTVELWARIHDLIVKTLILAQPHLKHSYQACRPGASHMDKCQSFEILGFDIILDKNLKPWLLEVNRSPSFGIDAQLDLKIKTGVISEALRLVDIRPFKKQKKIIAQRTASHKRLSTPKGTRNPLDFAGEIEDAAVMTEKKCEEIRSRLSQLRKIRDLEQFEDENMGDYSRVYPSPDSMRQMVYERLLADSARISFSVKPESRSSVVKGLEKMKERELVELLCQYESEEMTGSNPVQTSQWQMNPSNPGNLLRSMQPLSFREKSPLEAEFQAMAAREYEEEQTQRTMLSLNGLQPSYPGKEGEEVKKVIEEVKSNWLNNRPKVGTFWLNTLDSTKRKQLLCPMRDIVRNILHTHWRTAVLDSVRLHKVFLRLFNFLLSNHGQGLWCSLPGGTGEHWEKQFKRKSDVLSITESYCCRRVVELVQGTIITAYWYYEKQQTPRKSNPPPLLTRRHSSVSRRPLSVYETQRSTIVQLNGSSTSRQGKKSMSVPCINPTHSFPKIHSALVS